MAELSTFLVPGLIIAGTALAFAVPGKTSRNKTGQRSYAEVEHDLKILNARLDKGNIGPREFNKERIELNSELARARAKETDKS